PRLRRRLQPEAAQRRSQRERSGEASSVLPTMPACADCRTGRRPLRLRGTAPGVSCAAPAFSGQPRQAVNMAVDQDTNIMALFCDFENVALGVRDARYPKFDIEKVLERLLLKGNIVVKKAY